MSDIFDEILRDEFEAGHVAGVEVATAAHATAVAPRAIARMAQEGRSKLNRYSGAAVLAVGGAACTLCGALLGGLGGTIPVNPSAVQNAALAQPGALATLPAGSVPGLPSLKSLVAFHAAKSLSVSHTTETLISGGSGSAVESAVHVAKAAATGSDSSTKSTTGGGLANLGGTLPSTSTPGSTEPTTTTPATSPLVSLSSSLTDVVDTLTGGLTTPILGGLPATVGEIASAIPGLGTGSDSPIVSVADTLSSVVSVLTSGVSPASSGGLAAGHVTSASAGAAKPSLALPGLSKTPALPAPGVITTGTGGLPGLSSEITGVITGATSALKPTLAIPGLSSVGSTSSASDATAPATVSTLPSLPTVTTGSTTGSGCVTVPVPSVSLPGTGTISLGGTIAGVGASVSVKSTGVSVCYSS